MIFVLFRLTLKGVAQTDSRKYMLSVENKHGVDLAPVRLSVRGKDILVPFLYVQTCLQIVFCSFKSRPIFVKGNYLFVARKGSTYLKRANIPLYTLYI